MWSILVAVLLVVETAGGQNRVIYEEGIVQDHGFMVLAGQPQVAVQNMPLTQEVKPASSVVQFVVTPRRFSQEHQLFQFFIPTMQQDILLPSSQLPASCGPFIVSLEHETFRGRAYHFSWCHRAGQLYTHEQAATYCQNLAQHQPVQFEVLSLGDQEEAYFISRILQTHEISNVWTKDYSSSVPYSLHSNIDRLKSSLPGEDCLSVETDHSSFVFRSSHCLVHKAVICEADQLV